MDPKKRYRLSVLGVGIGFLALGWMNLSLHSEVENLSRRVSDYQENVTHWNQEFSRSLSNQETTIRDALASEASLFTGVETALDDQDGGLVLAVSLIPKEFSPGDTALLALDTGESIPLTYQENGRLTGALPCSLRRELKPSVTLLRGETRYSEALPTLSSDTLYLSGECSIGPEDTTLPTRMDLNLYPADSTLTLSTLEVEVRAVHPTDESLPGELLASFPASKQPDGSWQADLSSFSGDGQEEPFLCWIAGRSDGGLELHSSCSAGEVVFSSDNSFSYAYGSFNLVPVFPEDS